MDLLRREVHSVALAATVVALALTPRNAAALTALLAMCAWTLLVIGLRWRSISVPTRANAVTLAFLALPVGWLLVRALTSVSPTTSLVGNVGQHLGAFTWIAALALLAATLVTSEPGDAGRVVRALALAGAALAAATLLDAAGAIGSQTFSEEAAGIVENSISLSQALLVTLGAATAWGYARRSQSRDLWSAVTVAVVIVGGLIASRSTAAWVGLGAAGAFAATVLAAKGRPAFARAVGFTAAAVAAATTGAVVLALRDGVSGPVEAALAGLSNERFTIWTSAVAAAEKDWLLGRGPEQFSAWVTWGLEPGGAISTNGTYDPHNLWIYWLLAGGVVGLALAIAAGSAVLSTLAERPSVPRVVGAAGVFAMVVATMFGWVSVLGLAFSSALVGTLLFAPVAAPSQAAEGGLSRGSAVQRSGAGTASVAGVLAILVAALTLSFQGLAEYEWAEATGTSTLSAMQIARLAEDTGDPSLASQAVAALTGTDLNTFEVTYGRVGPALDRSASWHVDAAFSRFQVSAVRAAQDPTAWEDAEEALQAGRSADPVSGLWPVLGALQAQTLERTEDAREWAIKALEFPLAEDVEQRMKAIAGS